MKTTILTIVLAMGFVSNVSGQTYIYNQNGRNGLNGRNYQPAPVDHPAWFNGMTNSYFSGMYGRKTYVHYNPHYDYVEGSRLGGPIDPAGNLPRWGGLGNDDCPVVTPAPVQPKMIINPFVQ